MKFFQNIYLTVIVLISCGTISLAQTISFSPDAGLSNTSFDVTVTGTNTSWASNTAHCVELSNGITTFTFTGIVASTTMNILNGNISIPFDASPGEYNAIVYDANSGNCTSTLDGTCDNCFTITTPSPSISFSPAMGELGDVFTVTVVGTNTSWASSTNHCVELTNGATTLSFVGSVASNTTNVLTGEIDIPVGSDLGDYDAVVYDDDDGNCSSTSDGSCTDCFVVAPNTATISFAPNNGNTGSSFDVTVTGTNTSWASNTSHCVELSNGTSTFIFVGTVDSSTTDILTGTITIPADASDGNYDAKVYDSDAGDCSGTADGLCFDCFTISTIVPTMSNVPTTAVQGEAVDMTISGTDISWADSTTHCIEISNGLNTLTFEADVVTGMNSTLSGSFNIPTAFEVGDYNINVYQDNAGVCSGVVDVNCINCFSITTLISTDEQNASLSIYPNPAKEQLFVEHPAMSNTTNLQIYDVLGRMVYEQQSTENSLNNIITINTSKLNNGLYLLVIIDDDEKKIFEFIKSE